jgi:hypothetical protein
MLQYHAYKLTQDWERGQSRDGVVTEVEFMQGGHVDIRQMRDKVKVKHKNDKILE